MYLQSEYQIPKVREGMFYLLLPYDPPFREVIKKIMDLIPPHPNPPTNVDYVFLLNQL